LIKKDLPKEFLFRGCIVTHGAEAKNGTETECSGRGYDILLKKNNNLLAVWMDNEIQI
jgi:hypothetical protein